TTEGKARGMGHESTEIRRLRKQKSREPEHRRPGCALGPQKHSRLNYATEGCKPCQPHGLQPYILFADKSPTPRNKTHTRTAPSYESFAGAHESQGRLRTCPARTGQGLGSHRPSS